MERISIYLGSKCNANCQYCHRTEEPEVEDCSAIISLIQRHSPKRINFFGGEPLVYMKQIKEIMAAAPDAQVKITTNGILLPKYIDFIKEHDITLAISYDGGGDNDLRNINIPEVDLSSLTRVGISTTVYHGNTDFNALEKSLKELGKKLNHRLTLYPHIMHVTSDDNKKFRLTKEDYDSVADQWIERTRLIVESYEKYGLFKKEYTGMLFIFKTRHELAPGVTSCVDSKNLKVDMHGRKWDCLYIRDKEWTPSYTFPEDYQCSSCKVFSYCGGACTKSIEHSLECYYYKKLYTWWQKYYPVHKQAIDTLMERLS